MSDPDENSTVATRIAETIAERIIAGALKPDMPLRQDHVAREFNSSHVPVREAFRQLEAQHLVVALPRSTPIRSEKSRKCVPRLKWSRCVTPHL
jgi:DNA-binding GntR family transcriptional regulator